jgi:hypothetical protein
MLDKFQEKLLVEKVSRNRRFRAVCLSYYRADEAEDIKNKRVVDEFISLGLSKEVAERHCANLNQSNKILKSFGLVEYQNE